MTKRNSKSIQIDKLITPESIKEFNFYWNNRASRRLKARHRVRNSSPLTQHRYWKKKI